MAYDARHKETLRVFLKEYFELFFPDLAARLRFETAIFKDKELDALFDEEPALLTGYKKGKKSDEQITEQKRITDALILIEIEMDDHETDWILIHWEQQSTTEPEFEKRMFHCFCGIYFKYNKLVYPIAMFTDSAKKWKKKPTPNSFELSLFQDTIVKYKYQLIRLKSYTAEEFEKMGKENPLTGAYLPLTNYPVKARPLIKAKAFEIIGKLVKKKPAQAVLVTLVEKSLRLNKEEERKFREIIEQNNEYKEAKMLQSVEDVGRELGREEGREEGATNVISKQLRLKFRDKVFPYENKIKVLTLDQIEIISERILTCDTIESVFEGLNFSH